MVDNQYIILGGGTKVRYASVIPALRSRINSVFLSLSLTYFIQVVILNSRSLMTWERVSIAIWRSCFKEIKLNFIIICI